MMQRKKCSIALNNVCIFTLGFDHAVSVNEFIFIPSRQEVLFSICLSVCLSIDNTIAVVHGMVHGSWFMTAWTRP